MNVDGIATTEATNLDIEANDSIYVFVSITINPNATNLPFIVSDSILINYNGNNRYVQLQAFWSKCKFPAQPGDHWQYNLTNKSALCDPGQYPH